MKPFTIIKLAANNDINGNPRRVFVVMPHAEPWSPLYFEEGYDGENAVPDKYVAANRKNFGPIFDITGGEYRRLRKRMKEATA